MSKLYKFNSLTDKFEEIQTDHREAVHAVHADEMEPAEHPATGNIFTSRRKFNDETHRAGCIPAGGCDRNTNKPRSISLESRRSALTDALDKAYYDLRDNRIPRPRENPAARADWNKLNKK